jgi:hypothetical protein
MKKIMSLVVSIAIFCAVNAQETKTKTNTENPPAIPKEYFKTSENNSKTSDNKNKTSEVKKEENPNAYPLSKIAISVNPVGFVQFGPMVNIEAGVTKSLAVNAHVRFSSVGLLTYVVNDDADGLDELSGIAFGAGSIYFFGKQRNKPYAGILLEYEKVELLYAQFDPWEWKKTNNNFVFACNGGYRFRFKSGFFINTGAYLGAAVTKYEWNYTEPDYGLDDPEPREGTDVTPFGMVEVTLGFEF